MDAPNIVILAGPNGAGKTTVGTRLIIEDLKLIHFVNADALARGLSMFDPEAVAADAARIMLARLKELGKRRVDFGFETTLATRSFAPWLKELANAGFELRLVFVTVPSPEVSIERVRDRVRLGGHHVPPDVIRRRFVRGVRNFFELYAPLAAVWTLHDNAVESGPELIAQKRSVGEPVIIDREKWDRFKAYADA